MTMARGGMVASNRMATPRIATAVAAIVTRCQFARRNSLMPNSLLTMPVPASMLLFRTPCLVVYGRPQSGRPSPGSTFNIRRGHPMRLPRRRFLRLAAGAVALPAASRLARAQAYPARPVRVIVGQAAGSSSDITARLVGQWVSERLGQQFVVEVRPGAAGNIATESAVNAPPDGYTLLLVNAQNTINNALYEKLNFNFLRDIVPVVGIDRVPLVMEVNPSFPAKTVPEFIAYAKANPGKINMASAGIGGPQHVAGELFKFMAGVNL